MFFGLQANCIIFKKDQVTFGINPPPSSSPHIFHCCRVKEGGDHKHSLRDETEGLTSLEQSSVADGFWNCTINSFGGEELLEFLLIKCVAIWSGGVHSLHEGSSFVLLEGIVGVLVVLGEELVEKFGEFSD